MANSTYCLEFLRIVDVGKIEHIDTYIPEFFLTWRIHIYFLEGSRTKWSKQHLGYMQSSAATTTQAFDCQSSRCGMCLYRSMFASKKRLPWKHTFGRFTLHERPCLQPLQVSGFPLAWRRWAGICLFCSEDVSWSEFGACIGLVKSRLVPQVKGACLKPVSLQLLIKLLFGLHRGSLLS